MDGCFHRPQRKIVKKRKPGTDFYQLSSALADRLTLKTSASAAPVSSGSQEEREAFQRANHQNKLLNQRENHGLRLSIKVGAEMRKGCDFDVHAVVTNDTPSEKKCRLLFSSCAVTYNGSLGENCGLKDLLNVELAPGAGEPSHRTLNSVTLLLPSVDGLTHFGVSF